MGNILNYANRLAYYKKQFEACILNPGVEDQAKEIVRVMGQYSPLYALIADQFGIGWWQVIGVLHQMESGMDFSKHLANGDPLSADTVHVPVGIMAPKEPPYNFTEGAVAALNHFKQGWGHLSITDMPTALSFFDEWNGLGEWRLTDTPGCPYLFSGTSAYQSGKFASDGAWDPTLVSQQIGVAALCKAMGIRA